jgi:hypothetical protein
LTRSTPDATCFFYHLRNGFVYPHRKCGAVDRHAFLLGEHYPDQIIRSWQAAGVGGQKAIKPVRHQDLLQSPIGTARTIGLSAPGSLLPSIHS